MNRRAFLRTTSSLLAPAVMSRVLQDANAPVMPGGVQVGDVTDTRAMIWSATDRPARCSWKCRATSASRPHG